MTYLVTVDAAGFDTAGAAADALQEAFEHIARELFAPRPWDGNAIDFAAQRKRLAPRKVLITAHAHAEKKLVVPAKQWDRFELEMNLRQIEMIILALRTPMLSASTSVHVSPTQQGGADATGNGPDGAWVLEVFGGGDVTNNRKLAKDATALLSVGEQTVKLFACRRAALSVLHDEGDDENDVVLFRVGTR